MTKRFELKTNFLNGHVDIIDWVESEQKDAICIFNDLGVLPFSSAPSVCNLLNQLNDENDQLKQKVDFYKYFQKDARELEKENEQLKKDVEYWKQVASQYINGLNIFEQCKKYKTEYKDVHWSSD